MLAAIYLGVKQIKNILRTLKFVAFIYHSLSILGLFFNHAARQLGITERNCGYLKNPSSR